MKGLLAVLALAPLMALADTETRGEVTWSFTVVDGTATVTGADPASGYLEIPSSLGGYPVRTIGSAAFFDCSGLTGMTIPDGVTSIEELAFASCVNLSNLVIPSSVTNIAPAAFLECYLLADGDGFIIFGGVLYDYLKKDASVVIPSTVTVLGERALYGKDMTDLTIPSSVIQIGKEALAGCAKLKTVHVSAGKTDAVRAMILASGFDVGALEFAETVNDGGPYEATVGGVKWTFSVADGKATVGGADPCTGALEIPQMLGGRTVTGIAAGAFAGCAGLTALTIPETVTAIGAGAFAGCTGLFDADGFMIIGGVLYGYGGVGGAVVIPSGVETIASGAFAGCAAMTSVRFPASVTAIGAGAFAGCTGLKSVLAQPGDSGRVAALMEGSGYDVAGLAFAAQGFLYAVVSGSAVIVGTDGVSGAVEIPETLDGLTVTEIAPGAFLNCRDLVSVTVPKTVLYIGDGAFSGCSGLTEVRLLGDAPDVGEGVFERTPRRLQIRVPFGTIGWDGGISAVLPGTWQGRAVTFLEGTYDYGKAGFAQSVHMTVTNVVVHYVLNSIRPEFALPVSNETGFVNIQTEVKGGSLSIPETWAANYPEFTNKFGTDFTKALTMKTGKKDGSGAELYVWQDYVAGTDPTDVNDTFTATITMVDGKPVISYSPELDAERAALRKYTILGKKSLTDENWAEVPDEKTSEYNFFKVTVEMKAPIEEK